MKRRIAGLAVVALLSAASRSAVAQEASAGDHAGSSAWQRRFDDAGHALVGGDPSRAAAEYAALAVDAPDDVKRDVALGQLRIASEAARKAGAMPASTVQRDPSPAELPPPSFAVPPRDDPKRRTGDELFVLVAEAPLYSTLTGFFLDSLVIRRRSEPTVGVPLATLGLTGFAGLAIAMIDGAGGFRRGVPQSISTGINTGAAFGGALAMFALTGDSSDGVYGYRKFVSIQWSLATAGGIAGGILASTLPTTPGRSAWVGSAGMVTGILVGGIAGAAGSDKITPSLHAFGLAAAIGTAAGVGVGLGTAGLLSPSISRVRFLDLAWLSGGGIGLGTCIATGKCSTNGAFTALTIGTAIGAVAGFFGTLVMGKESLPTEAKPATGVSAFLEHTAPYVVPENGGATMGISGQL